MRRLAVAAACALALAGCDNMPWANKDGNASAGLTTAQSGMVPGKPSVLPNDVLASVNGVPISKADLELRIQELKALVEGSGEAWTPLTREQLTALLDEMVNNELASQDAVARGLDRSLETQRRWEYLRRQFFAQEWLRSMQTQLDVPSEQVERYYTENKEGFRDRESIRLRQLSVGSEEEAKRALSQLYAGSLSFESLARQISSGPSAADGGLLPKPVMRAADRDFMAYVQPDLDVLVLDPLLETAAFAITQANGLSSYVKGADGRSHIFQLVARAPEAQRPLAEVHDQIKSFLTLEKLQEAVDALKGKAQVERHEERLDSIVQ